MQIAVDVMIEIAAHAEKDMRFPCPLLVKGWVFLTPILSLYFPNSRLPD